MTGLGPEGPPARAVPLSAAEAALPERLPWPAAAAVILVVSLLLWTLIGLGIGWLAG